MDECTTQIIFYFPSQLSTVIHFVGYVDGIKKSLLNTSKEERKSVAEKYNTKVPEPLNSQFPDRVTKSVALDRYTQRKEREATKPYPVGKVPV